MWSEQQSVPLIKGRGSSACEGNKDIMDIVSEKP